MTLQPLKGFDAKLVPFVGDPIPFIVSDNNTPLQSLKFKGSARSFRNDRPITCRTRIGIVKRVTATMWEETDHTYSNYITLPPLQMLEFGETNIGQVPNDGTIRINLILEPNEPMAPHNEYLDAKIVDV